MAFEGSFKLPKETLEFLRGFSREELEEFYELKRAGYFLIQIMPRAYEESSLPGRILMDILIGIEELKPEKTYRTNISHHYARAISSHLTAMDFPKAVSEFRKLVEHALAKAEEAEEEKSKLIGAMIRNFFRLLICVRFNEVSRVPFHTQVIGERGGSLKGYLSSSAEEALEEALLMSETFWLEPPTAKNLGVFLHKLHEAFGEVFERKDLEDLKAMEALKKALDSLTTIMDELTVEELWEREASRC